MSSATTVQFVPALTELRDASVNEIIEKLFKTFSAVSIMDADEAVASFQTVYLVATVKGMLEDEMVKALLRAIAAQMGFLYHSMERDSSEKRALFHRFGDVWKNTPWAQYL